MKVAGVAYGKLALSQAKSVHHGIVFIISILCIRHQNLLARITSRLTIDATFCDFMDKQGNLDMTPTVYKTILFICFDFNPI